MFAVVVSLFTHIARRCGQMILDPVIHGVMNPVIQIVVGEVPDRFMEVMGDQLREIQEQNVPPNVARMLVRIWRTQLVHVVHTPTLLRVSLRPPH